MHRSVGVMVYREGFIVKTNYLNLRPAFWLHESLGVDLENQPQYLFPSLSVSPSLPAPPSRCVHSYAHGGQRLIAGIFPGRIFSLNLELEFLASKSQVAAWHSFSGAGVVGVPQCLAFPWFLAAHAHALWLAWQALYPPPHERLYCSPTVMEALRAQRKD